MTDGRLSQLLIDRGFPVLGIDVADHWPEYPFTTSGDFLALDRLPLPKISRVIMNPPYRQAEEFVRHALKILPPDGLVYALLRFNWIAAKRRKDLLPNVTDLVIAGRYKMLPPDAPDLGKSPTTDFAWFVLSPVPSQTRCRLHRV